jgi:adenylate kinase
MLNLILFGPPGAGKGTQSAKLLLKYNLIHLSTGDILRQEVAARTPLGLEAKELMDKGILVSDDIVIGMMEEKIKKHREGNGFIFDGFPRTLAQAESLDKLMERNNLTINLVLSLEINEDELLKRINLRAQQSGREDDKNENTFKKRMNVYNLETKPLLDYYKKQRKLKPVNGIGDLEDIFASLCSEIDHFINL